MSREPSLLEALKDAHDMLRLMQCLYECDLKDTVPEEVEHLRASIDNAAAAIERAKSERDWRAEFAEMQAIAADLETRTRRYDWPREQPTPDVSQGWKLVPVEPDIGMTMAALTACRAMPEADAPLRRAREIHDAGVVWAAMLAAAPAYPASVERADAKRAAPLELRGDGPPHCRWIQEVGGMHIACGDRLVEEAREKQKLVMERMVIAYNEKYASQPAGLAYMGVDAVKAATKPAALSDEQIDAVILRHLGKKDGVLFYAHRAFAREIIGCSKAATKPAVELPPLPAQTHFPGWVDIPYYTAQEMYEYARAAIAQVQEA
jgi:hypothetical protein